MGQLRSNPARSVAVPKGRPLIKLKSFGCVTEDASFVWFPGGEAR